MRFRAPTQAAQLARGEVELKVFDGVIKEIDDPFDEGVGYVLVVDAAGAEREWTSKGDLAHYQVGRRLLTRYLSIPLTVGDNEQMVFELWLDDSPDPGSDPGSA